VRQQEGSETSAKPWPVTMLPATPVHCNHRQPPVPRGGFRGRRDRATRPSSGTAIPQLFPPRSLSRRGRPASRVLRIALRATASGRP
jgi:hypothetical protein